jgi:hypothetical protein
MSHFHHGLIFAGKEPTLRVEPHEGLAVKNNLSYYGRVFIMIAKYKKTRPVPTRVEPFYGTPLKVSAPGLGD